MIQRAFEMIKRYLRGDATLEQVAVIVNFIHSEDENIRILRTFVEKYVEETFPVQLQRIKETHSQRRMDAWIWFAEQYEGVGCLLGINFRNRVRHALAEGIKIGLRVCRSESEIAKLIHLSHIARIDISHELGGLMGYYANPKLSSEVNLPKIRKMIEEYVPIYDSGRLI